ncbi:MAG: RNA 2',3'-cyclic phosphodiesterase [Spongiibacteraceae bacterium]
MRLFFGVPIEQPAALQLAELSSRVPNQRGFNWIDERNWHITLTFMGEVDGNAVNALCDLGEAVAANHQACKITLEQLQWWPSVSKPRLLACVSEIPGALNPMRKQLAQGLRELGVDFDGKPLRPHVTLMRLERGVLPMSYDLPAGAVSVDVESIALFSSERNRGETYYRPIWEKELVPLPPQFKFKTNDQ